MVAITSWSAVRRILLIVSAFLIGSAALTSALQAQVHTNCIVCTTYAVLVTPDGVHQSRVAAATGLTDTFTVKNNGTNNTEIYDISCSRTGSVAGCAADSSTVTLAAGASKKVGVTYSLGGSGGGTLTLRALGETGDDSDNGTYNITAVGVGAPSLSVSPQNSSYKNISLCISSCFDNLFSHSLPSYVSMGSSKAFSLVYNSGTVKPMPVVAVDAGTDSLTNKLPTSYKMEVKLASSGSSLTLANGSTAVYYLVDSTTGAHQFRLTAVIDAQTNGLTTGAYDVNVTVTGNYASGSYATTVATRFLVDDESKSQWGVGFGIPGMQRLYPVSGSNSVVITTGDGSVAYFARACPTCAFITPGGSTDSLSYDSGTGIYRRTALNGSAIWFNSSGRMTKARDQFGNTLLAISYLASPLDSVPQAATDYFGHITRFCFSSNCLGTGKLAKIIVLNSEAGIRTVTMTSDGSGRQIRVADPDGLSDSLAYNGNNLLTAVFNRARSETDYRYDAINRVDTVQAPTVTLYNGTGRPTVAMLAAETKAWQAGTAGTSLATAKAKVPVDSAYATTATPNGAVTRFGLDRFGGVVRSINPYGAVDSMVRDTAGRVTRLRQSNGHITTYQYTGLLLTQVNDVTTGQATNFIYTPSNAIRTIYGSVVRQDFLYRLGSDGSPVGAIKQVLIGGSSNNDTTVFGGTIVATHKVDGLGRDTAIVDAKGHGSHYTFEGTWGNVSVFKDSLGNKTSFHYDSVGRNDSTLAPHGRIAKLSYGLMNQVLAQTDSAGHSMSFKYDSMFDVIRISDGNGWAYKFDYNAVGGMVSRHSAADTTRADSVWFDSTGNIRSIKNRNGKTTAMTYDKLGRLVSRVGPDSLPDVFKYDTTTSLWQVASNANAYDSLIVDSRGRLIASVEKLHSQTFTGTYTYDNSDRLTARSLNKTGSSTYASAMSYIYPSTTGTLDSLCANTKCVSIHRSSNLLRDTVTYNAGGGSAQWRFTEQSDAANQTIGQSFSPAGLAAVNLTIGRDSLERQAWRTSPDANYARRKFKYDSDGQLLLVTDSGATSTHVAINTYDAGGNRYDSVGTGDTYGAGNRLLSDFNAGTDSFDLQGNVTCNGSGGSPCSLAHMYWNASGALDSLYNSFGTKITFGYDALGRRVKKQVAGGSTTWFAHDGGQVVLDMDGSSDSVKIEYSWFPGVDQLLSMKVVSGLNLAAITDPDNSTVRALATFDTGRLVKRFRERPWGDLVDTGLVVRFKFAGAEYDAESGLYYMRARYYDPRVGRFLSEDPVGVAGGINLYEYAGNDPVNTRDPSGLEQYSNGDEACASEGYGPYTGEWTYITQDGVVVGKTWYCEPALFGGVDGSGDGPAPKDGGDKGKGSAGPGKPGKKGYTPCAAGAETIAVGSGYSFASIFGATKTNGTYLTNQGEYGTYSSTGHTVGLGLSGSFNFHLPSTRADFVGQSLSFCFGLTFVQMCSTTNGPNTDFAIGPSGPSFGLIISWTDTQVTPAKGSACGNYH